MIVIAILTSIPLIFVLCCAAYRLFLSHQHNAKRDELIAKLQAWVSKS